MLHDKTQGVHENIRQYQCHLCQKVFSSNGVLNKHIQAVHGKFRDFQCQFCKHYYSSKSYLDEHILRLHKNEAVLEANQIINSAKK